jgi:hypothetical protein
MSLGKNWLFAGKKWKGMEESLDTCGREEQAASDYRE